MLGVPSHFVEFYADFHNTLLCMVMGGHFQHCRFSILVPFSKFKSVLLLFYFIHNPEFGTKQNSRVSLEDQIKLHSNQQQKHSQLKWVLHKNGCGQGQLYSSIFLCNSYIPGALHFASGWIYSDVKIVHFSKSTGDNNIILQIVTQYSIIVRHETQ